MHLNERPFDLAVVDVNARVLERIPHAFLKVVPITTSSIGRKQIELSFEQARKRLADPPREECAHLLAILTTFAAEERAVANIPVIPVDARRERQHKLEHGYRGCPVREGHRDVPRVSDHVRFQGGVDEGLAALAGAGEEAAGVAAIASRFL
ncbi:MAG: hypothetical protein KatS3mg114_0860 [Planctomycetaceae bacterium]|nr:MAG: hypothetical protein KatS3mg114_0860 [Planctomycetaceae bacterium]